MKGSIVKFLLKTAWVLELIIALFILLVTVVQMVLTGWASLDALMVERFSLTEFFVNTMSIVVGLEFVKMLVLHTPRAVTDVLLFAIARQVGRIPLQLGGYPPGGGCSGSYLCRQKVPTHPGGHRSPVGYPQPVHWDRYGSKGGSRP